MTNTSPGLVSSFRSVSKAASAVVILVGCLVLVGWMFDVAALKSILPNLVTKKANTAIGFVLAGVSLRLLQTQNRSRRQRNFGWICAAAVTLMGLLTLSQDLFGWNLHIDQFL